MNNWQAAQYHKDKWGVFSLNTRNWCIFGTERQMKARAASLNAQDAMVRELRALSEAKEELEA